MQGTMANLEVKTFIENLIPNIPNDWIKLTTHRLDIYNEERAKYEFLEGFEDFYNAGKTSGLETLPTAFDYIRLGHPLSCVLEWGIAKELGIDAEDVISFSSKTTPILSILRKNLFNKTKTQINFLGKSGEFFNSSVIKDIYGYNFETKEINGIEDITDFEGTVILVSERTQFANTTLNSKVDFYVNIFDGLGSVIIANNNKDYISEIQHVRRRETIAMTPANCVTALEIFTGAKSEVKKTGNLEANKAKVIKTIKGITDVDTNAELGSSGLSIQYGIVMGLIHHAKENHPEKPIKIVVPTNCYGGTNDQARRVAACIEGVDVVDLHVDGDSNMVDSTAKVLDGIAQQDGVPLIIAEIPTNPRVEVPVMEDLRDVLASKRITPAGSEAIAPVFILDQTFCPNVHFLGDNEILANVQTISYVSGSKFPSGGLCTAGYCVANNKANHLMEKIGLHLSLCDNNATDLQVEILASQMPSMVERIASAYANTREFVNFISEKLPEAKINFVSEELATDTFTPSVFSLDLPTKGNSDEEREAHKRALNLKLINMMIDAIPTESKYCVSYGQLKGCYWTIPATSTQGTTKEGDKDYIVRVALSGNMDLEKHKEVFAEFVRGL
ncbi:MAG: cystathionine beta-synthase [Crocinitomicaceae bacterium]|nr:cystathionine beta-synthase [Crocinitomicaceae bacterium]